MGMKNSDLVDELRESDRRVAAWMQGVEEEDLTDNCIQSEWKQEDRKFASQAVAFVIKHSRKGIVSLCASVATLMQEKAILQKQLRDLKNRSHTGQFVSDNSSLTSPSSATSRRSKHKYYSDKQVSPLPSHYVPKISLQNGQKNSSVSSSLSSKNGLQSPPQIVAYNSNSSCTAGYCSPQNRKLEDNPTCVNNSLESNQKTPRSVKKFAVVADVSHAQININEELKYCKKRPFDEPCINTEKVTFCMKSYDKETGDTQQELLPEKHAGAQCYTMDVHQSSHPEKIAFSNRSERFADPLECDFRSKGVSRFSPVTGYFQNLCHLHQKHVSEKLKNELMKKWLSLHDVKVKQEQPSNKLTKIQHKDSVIAVYPLKGCVCNNCCEARLCSSKQFSLMWNGKPLLNLDDAVIVCGDVIGRIAYIGHIDSCSLHGELFIGLRLDEAAGDTDGTYEEKLYFECLPNYGMFLKFTDVICLLRKLEYNMESSCARLGMNAGQILKQNIDVKLAIPNVSIAL